jgi:hypothetical protein
MVSWQPQAFLYLQQKDKRFRHPIQLFNCSTAHEAYRNHSIDVKLESRFFPFTFNELKFYHWVILALHQRIHRN